MKYFLFPNLFIQCQPCYAFRKSWKSSVESVIERRHEETNEPYLHFCNICRLLIHKHGYWKLCLFLSIALKEELLDHAFCPCEVDTRPPCRVRDVASMDFLGTFKSESHSVQYNNLVILMLPQKKASNRYISDSICFHACELADQVQSKAIITLTHSGYNAQKIASNRPNSFVYVFTNNKKIVNSLSLFWGIYAFYYDKFHSTDETIQDLHDFLKRKKILKSGQIVINIGSMPIMEKGMTNMLKVGTIT